MVQTDSLHLVTRAIAISVTIPKSTATLALTEPMIRNLPEGQPYVTKTGQASAVAVRQGDTLLFTASCDSLHQLIWGYEQELTRVRNQQSRYEKQSESLVSPFTRLGYGYTVFVTLLLIILLIRRK